MDKFITCRNCLLVKLLKGNEQEIEPTCCVGDCRIRKRLRSGIKTTATPTKQKWLLVNSVATKRTEATMRLNGINGKRLIRQGMTLTIKNIVKWSGNGLRSLIGSIVKRIQKSASETADSGICGAERENTRRNMRTFTARKFTGGMVESAGYASPRWTKQTGIWITKYLWLKEGIICGAMSLYRIRSAINERMRELYAR